jgi:hypothetical protein
MSFMPRLVLDLLNMLYISTYFDSAGICDAKCLKIIYLQHIVLVFHHGVIQFFFSIVY